MNITWISLALLGLFFITLFVNALGARGFFNGKGQAEVSANYQTYITPNNFAFSIWGVIYSLLLLTLLYLFLQRTDPAVATVIASLAGLFVLASVFNMAWIVSFSYEKMGISTIFIFGMMLSLMTIIGRLQALNPSFIRSLAALSFTLYASWVLIATFINFATFFIQKEWNRFGLSDSFWTIVILLVTILFASFYVFIYQNAAFPIALAWAFYGILDAYREGRVEPSQKESIQKVLKAGMVIFGLLIIFSFIKNDWAILPT